jgi:hypothetical protein
MVKSIAAGLTGAFLETKYATSLDFGTGSLGLPKLFGVTPTILTGVSFWALLHGFSVVGKSRSKYMALAKKDGEKDVEERYDLPNLYAQGTSKHAKAFNCAQRSHQQIFETFPQMCMVSMISAVHYPITAAVFAATYFVGRYSMSAGYANEEGDARKRYSSPVAPLIWYGYIGTIVVSVLSGISFVSGGAIL